MRTMNKTESAARPYLRITSVITALSSLLLLLACGGDQTKVDYFPEIGDHALYQRSLDVRNNLNVMSIAIQPGYEDLSTLAYYRMGKGARIMSVYVTNGEGGESDDESRYPIYLGKKHREEAFHAIRSMDGDARFINMPDIPAARNIQDIEDVWRPDSLRARLGRLILNFKPDIIFIPRDYWSESPNPRTGMLLDNLKEIVQKLQPNWEVKRIFIDDDSKKSITVPVDEIHPKWNKSYKKIATQAGEAYTSMAVQRQILTNNPGYKIVFPEDDFDIQSMDDGLEAGLSSRLRGIHQRIKEMTDDIFNGETSDAIVDAPKIMESINIYVSRRQIMTEAEKRALLQWKWDLENLRCALLGLKIDFEVSDQLLTERQLTFITIKQIRNLKNTQNVQVYFTGSTAGWVVDETMQQKFALKLNDAYRLLTPMKLTYTVPPGLSPYPPEAHGFDYYFYLIRQVADETENFVYHAKIHLTFAPSVMAEILTPIVRMIPDEKLVVRLTNMSRDGARDTVRVDAPLAQSTASGFIMNTKGDNFQDTLSLEWKMSPEDGTYIVPVDIYYETIGNFVARKFDANVSKNKKVGVITALKKSPVLDALRRLNVEHAEIPINGGIETAMESYDVIILDRRLLSLNKNAGDYKEIYDRFIQRGGHLLLLAQDAHVWNEAPLWEGLNLKTTNTHSLQKSVSFDEDHRLMNTPNIIEVSDWQGWLFSRGFNEIEISLSADMTFPAQIKETGSPLIVTEKVGQGTRTYVDLAFHQQWLNVHPGAYRLLANLISY